MFLTAHNALLSTCAEVYNLFDDVMVLSEGHIIYHGAREEVRTGQSRELRG